MKTPARLLAGLLLALPVVSAAEEMSRDEVLAKHREGAEQTADRQDELSADVEQLTVEQTIPKVIELLNEVEDIMDEATDQLSGHDTGGRTLAAQTEVIEKIHAAAKEKQKQSAGGQSSGAMMDMMERMMGKTPDGDKNGPGKGGKAGDQAGQGNGGASDSANGGVAGGSGTELEERRVPKAAGSAGRELPGEFQKALDAYNRGAEKKVR